ncbi:MAG: chitobiase/beta-hexosaminidase C-terminal domain-containing protein, partial [Vicinamibacterales bacterium]
MSSSTAEAYVYHVAEGATGTSTEDLVLVNPTSNLADVTITYRASTGSTIVQSVTVAATSRKTIRVNTVDPALANVGVSITVDSTQPLVVERSMFWSTAGKVAGHTGPSATPALTWYLAEGAAGAFQDVIVLYNPNANAADVMLDFHTTSIDPVATRSYTVPAASRLLVRPDLDIPELQGLAFSTRIASTNGVSIVVDRAMYWGAQQEVGHIAQGLSIPSSKWWFAEGAVGVTAAGLPTHDTYFVLFNTSATTTANVEAMFHPEDGSAAVVRTYSVAPRARATIWANQVTELADKAFSTYIRTTNNVSIVAERSMYWGNGSTWTDGHAAAGGQGASAIVFAEGRQGDVDGISYDTYFELMNTATSGPISVEATFFREDGTGIVRTVALPPRTRQTYWAGQHIELMNRTFSAAFKVVSGPGQVVAERSMYWGVGRASGTASEGQKFIIAPIAAPPTPQAANAPITSPAAGTFLNDVSVSIGAEVGATIRYTTTGADPTEASPIYVEPLAFTGTTTLKVRAFVPGLSASTAITATYQVQALPPSLNPAPGGS